LSIFAPSFSNNIAGFQVASISQTSLFSFSIPFTPKINESPETENEIVLPVLIGSTMVATVESTHKSLLINSYQLCETVSL
jgi:hypothetical protein